MSPTLLESRICSGTACISLYWRICTAMPPLVSMPSRTRDGGTIAGVNGLLGLGPVTSKQNMFRVPHHVQHKKKSNASSTPFIPIKIQKARRIVQWSCALCGEDWIAQWTDHHSSCILFLDKASPLQRWRLHSLLHLKYCPEVSQFDVFLIPDTQQHLDDGLTQSKILCNQPIGITLRSII